MVSMSFPNKMLHIFHRLYMRDVFPGLIFLFDLNVHVYLKMRANYESPDSRKGQKLIFLIKKKTQ